MNPVESGSKLATANGSRRLSLALFRTLPELEPALEFYSGSIVQKMSPRLPHSVIQCELMVLMALFARPAKLGRVYPELRCTFGGSSHVFDLCFFVQGRLPDLANPADCEEIRMPPDLAIEILSPGQTVAELTRKLRSAIRRGVRLGWLIDPKRRRVHVLHPTGPVGVLAAGDILAGEEVVPGFALPIDELFGWLAGDRGE